MASQVPPTCSEGAKGGTNYPDFFPHVPLPLTSLEMSAEIDGTVVRPSKRARASSNADNAPSLQCQVCHRTYDRLDHLNRHLDSRKHRSAHPEDIIDRVQIETKDHSVVENVLQRSIAG